MSVIVPARNEEKNISNCLNHLLNQEYPNFEIIVVDDRSSDKTPLILKEYATRSKVPFKTIRIEKLPPGWTGKNYAMFTGSKIASGEWLLFTDADTTHRPQSLSTALICALQKNLDFLTLAPETESKSFWEKTVQPLAVSSLALWFDPRKVNDPQSNVTLANGQFILIKKEAYEKAGGNEAVKNEVIEDVELAKRIRQAGFRLQFLDGTRLYSTRMYTSLKEIHTGWTRILTYLLEKNVLSILHKLFLFLFFSCLPFFVLIAEVFFKTAQPERFSRPLFILSLGVSLWIILIRWIGNKFLRSAPAYAILHLLGSLVMAEILCACLWRVVFKRGSVWRGDVYQ